MRTGCVMWAAASSIVLAMQGHAAFGATRGLTSHVSATDCSTSVVFGDPAWNRQTLTFRATADIACPFGVAFSAALRSANGCELRSSDGERLPYELFSDPSMQTAVVSCERETGALSGTGHRSFVMYGRVEAPLASAGEFHDALLTSITP